MTAVSSLEWVTWRPGTIPDVLDRDAEKARAQMPARPPSGR